ncbi:MAG: ABC transporter permease subunit [Treponema sp.]|jgi:peptide/nickel transport system permease protein|nr:ABC transporter permease subunit [Treponema sp.]
MNLAAGDPVVPVSLKKNASFIHRLLAQKSALLGLVIILFILLTALGAPLIAPHDPLAVDMSVRFQKPGRAYWLGADNLGRCIASRLIWGARFSLLYSLSVLAVMMGISIPAGLLAGYAGGQIDTFIMRVVDIGLAIPSFLLALAVVGALGPSIRNLVLAMGMVWWTPYARLIRTMTMQMKEQGFMLAAKAAGCTHRQMIFRHLLRNIAPALIVMAALEIGSIILAIASYSFIGLGEQPPTPEWGVMLSDGREFLQTKPQLILYPGLLIIVTVLGFNLFGEGLKNALRK